jgi:hypothetical protein
VIDQVHDPVWSDGLDNITINNINEWFIYEHQGKINNV